MYLGLAMSSNALVSISADRKSHLAFSAAAVDPRDGRTPAVLHKGFLLAGSQAPCDVHGRAIEGVAE